MQRPAGQLLVQLHSLERLGQLRVGLSYDRGCIFFFGVHLDGGRGERAVLSPLAFEVWGLSLEARGWSFERGGPVCVVLTRLSPTLDALRPALCF